MLIRRLPLRPKQFLADLIALTVYSPSPSSHPSLKLLACPWPPSP